MKVYRFLWVLVGVLLFSLIIPIAAKAGDEEVLMGRWRGEWYSYARTTTAKVELEITSISPLEGMMYKLVQRPGGELVRLQLQGEEMAIKGEVKDGKVLLKFTGPDGAVWDFELSLKGRILEGDGKGWLTGGSRFAYTNLHLEKVG